MLPVFWHFTISYCNLFKEKISVLVQTRKEKVGKRMGLRENRGEEGMLNSHPQFIDPGGLMTTKHRLQYSAHGAVSRCVR